MAGKRAVELALGLLFEQIRELAKSFLESVLEVCAGLSPEEVAIVMDDFEHGRAHMIEVLTNKLQQWTYEQAARYSEKDLGRVCTMSRRGKAPPDNIGMVAAWLTSTG